MQSDNSQITKLKVLIAAPLPPPDHGGIVGWVKIIRGELGKNLAIEMKFIDTMARYRAVTNRSLTIRWIGGSAQALRDTYRIYRHFKCFRPNLLHLCTSGGPATLKDILILHIAKWMRVPCVVHYHMGRLPNIITRAGIEWKLTRHAMRLADAVVPLDRSSESHIKAAAPDINVVKLPNMVDIDLLDRVCKTGPEPMPCPEGHIRLVYAGHVIPTKGLRELITSCVRLSDCPLVLDVLGPAGSDFQKELEKIASQKKNGDWLRLHGAVDHNTAIRYIAAADIFVLPSYTEGMPYVILEAMACRRAILSTTVGAVPEMLNIGGPEECGVCIEPKNTEMLTDAIRRLAADPHQRCRLGFEARQRAEQFFSARIGCEKLVNLWRSIIDKTIQQQLRL